MRLRTGRDRNPDDTRQTVGRSFLVTGMRSQPKQTEVFSADTVLPNVIDEKESC